MPWKPLKYLLEGNLLVEVGYLNTLVKKDVRIKELSSIIILSALGGIASAPLGYAGRLLSTLPFLSPITSQALSGLHVFWIVLSALLVGRHGSATMTGVLKGLVEAFLFSHLGILVILISAVEGVVVDIMFYVLKKNNSISIYIAGGFSSASNVIVLIPILHLPTIVIALMFLSSYVSGLIFGGHLSKLVFKALPSNLQNIF